MDRTQPVLSFSKNCKLLDLRFVRCHNKDSWVKCIRYTKSGPARPVCSGTSSNIFKPKVERVMPGKPYKLTNFDCVSGGEGVDATLCNINIIQYHNTRFSVLVSSCQILLQHINDGSRLSWYSKAMLCMCVFLILCALFE